MIGAFQAHVPALSRAVRRRCCALRTTAILRIAHRRLNSGSKRWFRPRPAHIVALRAFSDGFARNAGACGTVWRPSHAATIFPQLRRQMPRAQVRRCAHEGSSDAIEIGGCFANRAELVQRYARRPGLGMNRRGAI